MERLLEPELMDDPAQALAYAQADFAEPHDAFVRHFRACFPDDRPVRVLDLGCGPADVTRRFARAYPEARVTGVDGAEAMLALGREAVAAEKLGDRVELVQGRLPEADLPQRAFDAVISNSLLHHLPDPGVLWAAIGRSAKPNAAVFVMDLRRPGSREAAEALVQRYAEGEPEVLRRDFYHSLLAAFTPEEIGAQLGRVGLCLTVEVVSDRHVAIHGRMPA